MSLEMNVKIERIYEHQRIHEGWTRQDVADYFGVKEISVIKWLSGERSPHILRYKQINELHEELFGY